jgi:SAM-dependent methyltransferase
MTNLGLPLEYRILPQFFDAWNVSESTAFTNSIIEKLLRQSNVESVLDMTCGTGSQVFYLKERGYNVVGSDFSPELLIIARDKAKKLSYDLKFIDGDMRDLKVGKFDSVITIFNAVGHVTSSDFAKTMKNINCNLKLGALYIFDIFNLQAMTDSVIYDFAYQIKKEVDNMHLLHNQCSTLDRENALLVSYDQYMVQKQGDIPTLYENKFSLQVYRYDQLDTMLANAGFKVISVSDVNGKTFIPDKSKTILIAAEKISEI